jgi:hypothetical protein
VLFRSLFWDEVEAHTSYLALSPKSFNLFSMFSPFVLWSG